MAYHPTTQQITELLATHNCPFTTFEHEPVRTSEEAARIRPGYTLQQGAKALIVRVKSKGTDDRFAMLVFPADMKFNSRKARTALSASDVRFASEAEVANLTGGIEVGAVPPFGNLFGLDVIADPALFKNEQIVFNAGDRRFSVAMRSEDYRHLVAPVIAHIIAE